MIRHTLLASLLAVTGLVVTPGTARAQFTSYTSFADFVAGVTNPVVDDFDDVPVGFVSTPIARSITPYSYQASTTTSDFFNVTGSGSDVWLSVNAASSGIVFDSFSPSVQAIGGRFFATSLAGAVVTSVHVRFFATTTSGSTFEQTLTGQTATSFFGIHSGAGPLASLRVDVIQANPNDPVDFITVNDLVVAPEPQAWALMATGLLALGVTSARRRRRR